MIFKDMPPREMPGDSAQADFARLMRQYDGRFKYLAERLRRDWKDPDLLKVDRLLRTWSLDFDGLLYNAHANAYAAGARMAGAEANEKEIVGVARAIRDLESYYSRGFENDLQRQDARYFDEDGHPKPEAIHDRMRMYLGRCRGTAYGGWVDGADESETFAWVLGATETGHCPDCPLFAEGGPYEKGNLPAVPGDNTTPCLFHCTCHLKRLSDNSTGPDPVELDPYDDVTAIEPPPLPAYDEDPVLIPLGGSDANEILLPPVHAIPARKTMNVSDRKPIIKSYSGAALKTDVGENTLKVVASTMGTADDRSGDVIFPGAYKGVLDAFLKDGFVAIGHEWDELPIAMPMEASEEGQDLVISAQFHNTPEAQAARTVCKERLDAGKSVSLSVGFMPDYNDPDGVVWFEKGTDLLAWAAGKGIDLSGFDIDGIGKLGWCRAILKIAELFEFSIVGVGMNRGAKAIAAKSARKSQANTVSAILQAKIHQAFTVAADELAIRGYMTTEERIELSSNISVALRAFAAALNPDIGDKPVSAEDVDWIASKSSAPQAATKTAQEQFDEALDAFVLALERDADIAVLRGKISAPQRERLVKAVETLESAFKSEAAPDADPDPDTTREARIRGLHLRMLDLKTRATAA